MPVKALFTQCANVIRILISTYSKIWHFEASAPPSDNLPDIM